MRDKGGSLHRFVRRPYVTIDQVGLERAASGLAALRDLRRSAGLTQEALASAAGLHVRTIRLLESHRVTSPRRDTLSRIATALSMTVAQRQEFLAAWDVHEPLAPTDVAASLVVEGDSAGQLRQMSEHNLTALSFISVTELIEVDAALNVARKTCQEVIMSNVDNFRRWYHVYRPDFDVELSGFGFTPLQNFHLGETLIFADQGVKTFEVVLDRPLDRGQTAVIHHHTVFPPAPESDTQRTLRGFLKPIPNLVIEIQFQPGAIPTSCEEIYQRRPLGVLQRIRELELNSAGQTHIAINNGPPGGYGIQWH